VETRGGTWERVPLVQGLCRQIRQCAVTLMQGMSLVPAVTELLLAEFMYLQFDDPKRPIYLYINSTGVQVRAPRPALLGCYITVPFPPAALCICGTDIPAERCNQGAASLPA